MCKYSKETPVSRLFTFQRQHRVKRACGGCFGMWHHCRTCYMSVHAFHSAHGIWVSWRAVVGMACDCSGYGRRDVC